MIHNLNKVSYAIIQNAKSTQLPCLMLVGTSENTGAAESLRRRRIHDTSILCYLHGIILQNIVRPL